jgi:F0F1-type ATP synthase delta subunit
VHKEIVDKIDDQLNQLNKVMSDKVPKFNELVKQKQVSAISIGDIM